MKPEKKDKKACPKCRVSSPAEAVFCPQCGYQFLPYVVPKKQMSPFFDNLGSQPDARPSGPTYGYPNRRLIIALWISTLFTAVVAMANLRTASLFDTIPVLLAIILICSRSRIDRVNGWTVIGMESLAFMILVLRQGGG